LEACSQSDNGLSNLPPRRNVLPKPIADIQTRVAFSVAFHICQSLLILNKILLPHKRNAECHAYLRKWRVADFSVECHALLRSKLGKKRMLDENNCKVYSAHMYTIYLY